MLEMVGELVDCKELLRGHGSALWRFLSSRKERMRPWSEDEYRAPGVEIKQACHRGEQIWIEMCGGAYLLNADFETGSLILNFEFSQPESTHPVESAKCQVQFFDSVCDSLRATYGRTDQHGKYPAGLRQAVSDREIVWLFWLNYFDAEYLTKFGVDFFRSAPFYEVRELGKTGIRCSLAPNPAEIDAKRTQQVIAYFASAGLAVSKY
jgi:hypothetical protein